MNNIKKFDLKKFVKLFATLTLVICLAFCVACGVNSSESSSTSSGDDDKEETVTATDYQVIKNGDFEFGTSGDKVTYPVYTGINWTRYRDNSYSTSAISSTKNSGIINTEDEAYNEIAESNNFPKDGDKFWNPKTPEFYGLGGERYVFDEETFEKNPNEDKLVTSGDKILMIHNVSSVAGRGTAQNFVSSSSLSTTTGYAKLSVWVNTKDLKSLQQNQPYGAYISVNNNLSSSRSPFVLKNINTNGVWANYVIYLETSDYCKSTFTVTVGLGFGSDTYRAEYVEGFAYFDEIHFEEIDKETFETETADVANTNVYSLFDSTGETVEADTLKVSQFENSYVANDDGKATTVKYIYSHLMESTPFENTYTGDYNKVYQHGEDYLTGATAGIAEFNTLAIDGVVNPYGEKAKTAYIKLANPSSYSITSNVIEIADGAFKQFNFMTNVDVAITGQPGAKIEVEEVSSDGSTVYGTVAVATDYNTYSTDEKQNVWKKVSVFVSNDLGTSKYIRFKFTLGPTDNVFDASNYNLTQGYALFTGFNERTLPENEYNIVSSEADYKSTITLGYEYPNGPEKPEEETEDFAFNATHATSTTIKTNLAQGVTDYTGVVGEHTMVGGTQNAYTDANVVSGVANSKYVTTYTMLTDAEKDAILGLAGETTIQPLVIKNTAATSYGYLGSQLTFSANTTNLVSVQVKVLEGATAYVYLANADPLSYFGVLEVNEEQLYVDVTNMNQPTAADKWVTVNFVVTTGDEDITYRVELWNGSRDGAVQSQGTVLFNKVEVQTNVNLANIKAKLDADFGASNADIRVVEHTRATSTVTTTNANGEEVTYQRVYEPQVVYTQYLKGASIIASFETIHAPLYIDETTSTDDSSSSVDSSTDVETTPENAPNVALQITSIIIAVVLVLVLVVVVVRLLVKKNKKVQVATTNFYNRDSRQRTQELINANKAKRAKLEAEKAQKEAEQAEEEKPYDYDNPENNI